MATPLVIQIAERLFTTPAAPYHEAAMQEQVREISREYKLPLVEDEFGNLLVTYENNPDLPPLVLAAHLDHPGFVIRRQAAPGKWIAEFLGGVGDAWFRPGIPLLLMPGRLSAVLGERLDPHKREFEILAHQPASHPAQFAVWDLLEFERSSGILTGRACDDLAGVAATLAVLAELREQNAPVHVIGALSRAEEVGFHGALCLAKSGRLPREGMVISLETSRELPPVSQGAGVIIRVGDKASIFHSEATRFLTEVAEQLGAERPDFKYQRALMPGGTCEGTAYQEFGYRTAALCIALGNYHNCGENHQIAAEFVSEADLVGMARLLVSTAKAVPRYAQLVSRIPERLQKSAETALQNLRSACE